MKDYFTELQLFIITLQDVANHIAELNLLWTDVQKDFIGWY